MGEFMWGKSGSPVVPLLVFDLVNLHNLEDQTVAEMEVGCHNRYLVEVTTFLLLLQLPLGVSQQQVGLDLLVLEELEAIIALLLLIVQDHLVKHPLAELLQDLLLPLILP